MTCWRGGVEAGINEHRNYIGIGARFFCPLLKGCVLHPAEVLTSTPKRQGLKAIPPPPLYIKELI
jgi:hypothetical protein